MIKEIIQYGMIGFMAGIVIYMLFKLRIVFKVANEIATHTLKRKVDGVWYWSPTKLTMASAWFVVLWSYHYDLIKNGFNEYAFSALLAVAVGVKITDAVSKKINPLIQPPKDEKPE